MALIYKPHTVLSELPQQMKDTTTKVKQVLTYQTGQAVRGMVTPNRAGTVQFDPETGDALNNPHWFLFEVVDAAKVGHWGRITWGSRKFEVVGKPTRSDVSGPLDHMKALLEEREIV